MTRWQAVWVLVIILLACALDVRADGGGGQPVARDGVPAWLWKRTSPQLTWEPWVPAIDWDDCVNRMLPQVMRNRVPVQNGAPGGLEWRCAPPPTPAQKAGEWRILEGP